MNASNYEPVYRWLEDSRSEESKRARRAILMRFCKYCNMEPQDLLNLAGTVPPGRPQWQIEEKLRDYLNYQRERGKASSTVANWAGEIRRFFKANIAYANIKVPKEYRVIRPVYESNRILTQEEVTKMIAATEKLDEQALICVATQSGQRLGIHTGLRYDMITRYPQKDGKVYGIAEVKPEISNRLGKPVQKGRQHYNFGIHWESMSLLDKMREKTKDKDAWVWNFGKRDIQKIIFRVAKNAEIQKKISTTMGKAYTKQEIHPHMFRRYWVARMNEARVTNEKLIEYQLGHSITSKTYYWGMFTDEEIIAALKQADDKLGVLSLESKNSPSSMRQ